VERCGIISIEGWHEEFDSMPNIELRVDGEKTECNEFYRTSRPDVAAALKVNNVFLGFSYEVVLNESMVASLLQIALDGEIVWSQVVSCEIVPPHYSGLLAETDVRHRDQIYGSGRPAEVVSGDVLQLMEWFVTPGEKVLDFGCGRGNIVGMLREKGIEALGIEIDRPAIKAALLPQYGRYIKLYDGSGSLPYEDGQFDSVLAFEVLEHVENYPGVLREIGRISKKKFIMSVPDISAIPRCFPQKVVPWHLLEATHFNFFTERSLTKALSPYWPKIRFVKIGQVYVNDSRFADSLVAICEK